MSVEQSLVNRCKEGDLGAFAEIFRRYEAEMFRLAVTILRHEQDAEDAVQDAYLRVFERIDSFSGDAAFKTWLTAILVNVCRDRLRRRKVRRALALDWLRDLRGPHNVVEEVARRQVRQTLWEYVDRLDDNHRLPVILHYYARLSCGEVAEVLNLPTSTVYSRLNTARIRLRAMASSEQLASDTRAEAC
jgi:RNA polymerase sigma-70 factor (ECF subfamily)